MISYLVPVTRFIKRSFIGQSRSRKGPRWPKSAFLNSLVVLEVIFSERNNIFSEMKIQMTKIRKILNY